MTKCLLIIINCLVGLSCVAQNTDKIYAGHLPVWKETWFVALFFFKFLLIVYLIYQYKIRTIRREEQQKAEIKQIRTEAEAATLRANINPDFLFNGLNTIETYILTNRRREATIFIQTLSRLIKKVVENSREELVCLEDDLQVLKLFIQLEEERYDHVFHTEFDIDTALLENRKRVPPLLIQPFVESAISQSLVDMTEKGGILKIILKSEKQLLKVIIECNVPGSEELKKMNEQTDPQKPIAVTLKRIAALGHLYESETSCKVTDNAMGTRVELLLPLK